MDASEGRDVLQRDLDRLEEWASQNSMKFNDDKCKVLHLGLKNQNCPEQARISVAGNSFTERGLGLLVDNNLNMSQQSATTATKANQILICICRDINCSKVLFLSVD